MNGIDKNTLNSQLSIYIGDPKLPKPTLTNTNNSLVIIEPENFKGNFKTPEDILGPISKQIDEIIRNSQKEYSQINIVFCYHGSKRGTFIIKYKEASIFIFPWDVVQEVNKSIKNSEQKINFHFHNCYAGVSSENPKAIQDHLLAGQKCYLHADNVTTSKAVQKPLIQAIVNTDISGFIPPEVCISITPEDMNVYKPFVSSGGRDDMKKIQESMQNRCKMIFARDCQGHGGEQDIKDYINNLFMLVLERNPIYRIVKFFRKNKQFIDINYKNLSCRTYLSVVTGGDEERLDLVEFLIANGANCNLPIIQGETPIFLVSEQGHQAVVEFLIANGADVNWKRNDGATAIFLAVKNGHRAVVKLLIDNRADVNWKMNNGATPIFQAIEKRDFEMVELLLDNGAHVNLLYTDGFTPLYIAAYQGDFKIVKLLLDHSADVNLSDTNGFTPLYIAVDIGDFKIVKLLLDHGADVNFITYYGLTALMNAVLRWGKSNATEKECYEKILELLIQKTPADSVQKFTDGIKAYCNKSSNVDLGLYNAKIEEVASRIEKDGVKPGNLNINLGVENESPLNKSRINIFNIPDVNGNLTNSDNTAAIFNNPKIKSYVGGGCTI